MTKANKEEANKEEANKNKSNHQGLIYLHYSDIICFACNKYSSEFGVRQVRDENLIRTNHYHSFPKIFFQK